MSYVSSGGKPGDDFPQLPHALAVVTPGAVPEVFSSTATVSCAAMIDFTSEIDGDVSMAATIATRACPVARALASIVDVGFPPLANHDLYVVRMVVDKLENVADSFWWEFPPLELPPTVGARTAVRVRVREIQHEGVAVIRVPLLLGCILLGAGEELRTTTSDHIAPTY